MSIDKNKTSKSEIIRTNFIGVHAAAALASVTEYFIDKNKRFALNYMPEPQGAKLMVSYRFEQEQMGQSIIFVSPSKSGGTLVYQYHF